MAKEELSQFLKNRKFVLKDNRKKWLGRNFITLKTDDGIEPQIEFSIDGETRSLIGGYDTFCWTLKVGGTELQRISFKSDLFKTDLYAFVETQSEKYPGLKDLLNKTERLFHTTKELELEEMESWMPAQQPESSDDEAILPSSTEESQPWQYYDPKIAIKNEVEEFIKLYQIQDRTEAQNKQYWDFIQKLYSLIKSIERTKLMGLPYNSTTEVMLKIATEELQLYLAELKKYGIELIEEAREKKASTRKKSKQTAPPSTSSFSLANFLLSSLFMTTGVSGGLNFSANSTGLAVYNHPYSSAPFNPTGTSLHQYNNPLGFGSQPIPSLQYYLTDGKGLNCLVAPQNCLSSSIVESRSLALFSPITNTLPPPLSSHQTLPISIALFIYSPTTQPIYPYGVVLLQRDNHSTFSRLNYPFSEQSDFKSRRFYLPAYPTKSHSEPRSLALTPYTSKVRSESRIIPYVEPHVLRTSKVSIELLDYSGSARNVKEPTAASDTDDKNGSSLVIFQNEESEESPVVSLEAITEPEQQLVAKSETPTQDSVPPANLLGTEATEIAKGGHVNTTNATIIGDSNDTESEESPAVPLEAITEPEQQSVAKPKTPTQGSVPPVNLLGTEATEIAEGGHVNTTNATIIGDSNDTESEKSPVVSLNNTEPEQRPPADPEMLPVGIPPVNALDDEATLEGNKTRPVNTTIIRDSDSVATEKEAEGDSYILPFAVGLGVGTIIKAAPSFRASTDKSDPHSSSLSSPSSPAPAPVLPPPLIPPSKTSSSATDDLDDKTTPIHEHTSGDSPTMPPLSDIALEDFNDIARDIIEKAKVSEGKRKMEIYKHSKTIHGRSTLYHETRRDGSDINCFDMLESSTQRFLVLAQTAENALARHQIDSIEAKRIALGISAKTEKEAEAHISCLPDEIKYPNGKGNMQHPFKCSTFINPNNKTIIKIEILDPKLYSANGTESIKDTRLIELKENQVFYDIICKINEKGLGNFLQECNQGRACTP